jgi:hypothetical protein
LVNQRFTESIFVSKQLEFICPFNKYVGGGASTTEFMASILVDVGDVIITPADCNDEMEGWK